MREKKKIQRKWRLRVGCEGKKKRGYEFLGWEKGKKKRLNWPVFYYSRFLAIFQFLIITRPD